MAGNTALNEAEQPDSAIGLLTGVALALFYVTAGLPLALVADRSNRRNLIAASLLAWSLATAACGLIRTFGQFMVARILVGVGEAGGTPPSHSLVSDYFPSERRALALSIYSIGRQRPYHQRPPATERVNLTRVRRGFAQNHGVQL